MTPTTHDPVSITPWYRQRWPWLLMLMPALAVVGGFITLWFAMTSNNALVVDDYYREGKAINRELARDRTAAARGLTAQTTRVADGTLVLRMSTSDGPLPPFVMLRLVHATRAELDRTLTLSASAPGDYTAQDFTLPDAGRWHVLLEDPDRAWRLTATFEGGAGELRLLPHK